MHVGWGVRLLLALALATSACARPGDLAGALRPDTDEGIAEATILTMDDFPSSWDQQPQRTDFDAEAAGQTMQRDLDECLDVETTDVAHVTSPWFYGPTGSPAVTVTASVAPTPRLSAAIGLLQSDAAPDCYAGYFATALSAAPDQAAVDASDMTVEPLPDPGLGDESAALRATQDVPDDIVAPHAVFDLVGVRVGRVLITALFASVNEPFDSDHSAELLQTMVDRAMRFAEPIRHLGQPR